MRKGEYFRMSTNVLTLFVYGALKLLVANLRKILKVINFSNIFTTSTGTFIP